MSSIIVHQSRSCHRRRRRRKVSLKTRPKRAFEGDDDALVFARHPIFCALFVPALFVTTIIVEMCLLYDDDDVNDDEQYYYYYSRRRRHEWTLASFLAFFLVVFIRYAIPNGAKMFGTRRRRFARDHRLSGMLHLLVLASGGALLLRRHYKTHQQHHDTTRNNTFFFGSRTTFF